MELPRRWIRIDVKGDNYSGRTGHSWAIANNGFYLFGGADSETRTNDIYFFHARKRQWTKIRVDGDVPAARSGAQSVAYDSKIYFFGGYTKKGGVYFNDLFSFDIVNANWDFYGVTDSPSERTDHSLIVYNNAMYLYGGRDETKIFSDLYKFNFDTLKWTCLENNIEEPRMRFGHTAVQWKNYMYIFGGWDGFTTLSDLYWYDIETEQWALINTQDEVKGRYRHSAVASDTSMFVFGGIDQNHERFNEIIEFDFNSQTWSKLATIGNPPSPRTFHQAAFYNGRIYIMGGFDGWKRNDMYKILIDKESTSENEEEKEVNSDGIVKKEIFTPEYFQSMPLNKWQKVKWNGSVYTPRTGHEVIAYDEKVYLFGGTDDDQRKNDLYWYDIYKNTWEKLNSDGDVPSRRSGARGIAYKGCIYIFGGYFKKSDEYYNDLYEYNLEKLQWSKVTYLNSPPGERIDHSWTLYKHHMYVFGGFDGNSRFNDFWRLDLRDLKWKKIIGCGEIPTNRFGHTACIYDHSLFIFGGWNGHFTMDDVFQYSFASNFWYEIKRTKPLSRYRHSAVMVNQKMYIFGGVDTSKQRFNDFYSYDVEKRVWIKEETTGDIPKPRTFHRAVSFGNIMYLIGGFDGSRLNDMYIIALPVSLYEEDRDLMRMGKRPQTSGSILTVPSDMPIEEFEYDADTNDLKYTVFLLRKQVEELSQRLKFEEERNDMCKICYTKEIDTVFLEWAHRFSCHICASTLKKCPFWRSPIERVIRTY